MGKFSNTFALMRSSWQILKKDKEILFFPLFSVVCCILVTAAFVAPMIGDNAMAQQLRSLTEGEVMGYVFLFLFFYCNYFIIVFFNVAIIDCANTRLKGGDPTVASGLKAAISHIHLIAGWAAISATVGLLLKIIESKAEQVGHFIANLLGAAWTLVSFLVIPVMIIQKKSPIESLKESTRLVKESWGEHVISNFSFGLIFFVLSLPAIFLVGFALTSGQQAIMIGGVITCILYLLVLALIQTALHTIFQVVVYRYIAEDDVPEEFGRGLIASSYS